MSYLEHFGLDREPFSNAPDARFYYNSEQHRQAMLRLMHVVDSNKGLAVVIGGVGTGKTTLARRMLDFLDEENYVASLLVMVHSGVTPEWILTRIALQLGVDAPAPDRMALLKQLYDRLIEIEASGRKAVVLIDEAQMLQTRELMEEFRGLLNLEIPAKKLLNILFFGLPEVEDCLRLDEPLAQRVSVKYRLQSYTHATAEAYISHRLQVAGAIDDIMAPETIPLIHSYAGGVPRLINTICDNCLFEAFLQKHDRVTLPIVETVAGDLGLSRQRSESFSTTLQAEPSEDIDDIGDIDEMLDSLERKF
ncbi:MAG: AAA family ATPase [Syntrophotalea acetylenica]|jgi:type II secretory pathway predicted ATPase ExeA|uniref:AAA family ATPase n=1 Tax=Syntrophotalea acetylenica TaxID=29542 RepID=A0A1L3GIL4_SYNAC|nr:AAA family ATPase [Syntrophotalea acetylenica]APG25528.1 AAA family ATPase [Syntrophotalea acetylenica]APG43592.1 AAA family ATPase [Syntrophotalea acetylenica]MDD4456378.1 AAA family ATPase [Syntrophotalea acetylenica]MDY0262105.1 AAA family ATPase [Syntrophotalea acetylenica]